mmetsp:Transcript_100656/g.323167  ORF Transcript_100656/g.323167 Transcript_100656/m.323167 type:complete len:337 (-) Transcript_100656:64-1074(-)
MSFCHALRMRKLMPSISAAGLALYTTRSEVPRPFASCETAWPRYKKQYEGQLTPPRHFNAADGKSLAPVNLHSGPYGSRWMRIMDGASTDDCAKALAEIEDGSNSAVYVGVPDDHPQCGSIVSALRAKGYQFHHFWDGNGDQGAAVGELIYYRWTGKGPDTVPNYYTALEGVGCLVLSPERDAVLLVWEYGHWKMITGNVDSGESMTETSRREIREEVGLEVEDSMRLIGGWSAAKSRDNCINNVFCVFAVTAKSRSATVDGVEIVEAKWFPISALPTKMDEANARQVEGQPYGMEWDVGVPGRNIVSRAAAILLDVYRQGRGLHVTGRYERDWFE